MTNNNLAKGKICKEGQNYQDDLLYKVLYSLNVLNSLDSFCQLSHFAWHLSSSVQDPEDNRLNCIGNFSLGTEARFFSADPTMPVTPHGMPLASQKASDRADLADTVRHYWVPSLSVGLKCSSVSLRKHKRRSNRARGSSREPIGM